MANFRYISEEQKRLVLIMYLRGTHPKDIKVTTGISIRTIQRLKKSWLLTGQVVKKTLEPGRPRTLTSLEVEVCQSHAFESPISLIAGSILRAS